jgi:hypothetical protein
MIALLCIYLHLASRSIGMAIFSCFEEFAAMNRIISKSYDEKYLSFFL